MKGWLYVLRRVLLVIPQMLLISVATFTLVRLLPGDPARLQVGPFAPQSVVDRLRAEMRLDEPLPAQYLGYLERIASGNLGESWVNRSDVLTDLKERVPATLELMTLALTLMLLVLLPLGVLTAARGGGWFVRLVKRVTFGYGLLAGSLPDFFLAILLVFIFFTLLGIAPGPEGRLSIGVTPPPRITGFYLIDSLAAGDISLFANALSHLILPAITLAVVYGGAILKMTRTSVGTALRSQYTVYSEALGLPQSRVSWFALRVAAPPIVLITGIVTGFLLGGAVLVEKVFNLNGIGGYAVQAITTADYAPIQGFVLVAAVFTMLVYLVVDLLYFAVDPRVRVEGRE
jgi:ABC-type dipeptide/oligopeptide/nickel transport system permease component